MLDRSGSVFVAGHRGLVGSAVLRRLGVEGFDNLLTVNWAPPAEIPIKTMVAPIV